MELIRDIIIIGSGPAGLTAGIYTGRAQLKPLILAGLEVGGQLMGTTLVENFPGFENGVMGPELMQSMIKQAENAGAELVYKKVTKVDFKGKVKRVWVGEEEFKARSVIIASGSSPRTLGLESEKKYWGRGVSTCATCDGAFYKEKIVAVIGGGDSAAEEASYLTKHANKVYMIHRRNELRASKVMVDRVLNNPKIEILWNTEIRDILGNETVTGLRLFNNVDKVESDLDVDGMFLAIGHIPNSGYLGGELETDEEGFLKTIEHTKTSIEGIFVAGDVHDHKYQQAITAAGMGCMAAMDAERWLESI